MRERARESRENGSLTETCHIAKMGYKQELRRAYSTVQIFAVAFSIMGLVPSIASTISFSLPAGPAGMVWVGDFPLLWDFGARIESADGGVQGWLTASILIFFIGLSLVSSPPSGRIRFWIS